MRLATEPTVHSSASIVDSSLGRWTEVAERTQIHECELGDYSYVMNDCDLMYTRVGRFCSIASHVRINPSNHPMDRPSQHHFTYRGSAYGLGEDDAALFDWRRESAVTIGHDVWIGHGAIIMLGVTVGTGAVIGAGTVLTKDVEPYGVYVGVPGRRIRYRFSKSVQDRLLELAWWDWEHEKVGEALKDFQGGVEAFLEKYEKE